ncbi:MAG TPA: 5'-nucleotidase C-terminal domain-containing protein [Anaerolineales bacterium]|nr:5'-nucleotidase C-terminal domain-containing protein [Anaerolineales bacterium]
MASNPLRITIFHTNDMHGRMEAMARLSAFARQLRREAEAEGRRVFFWDAGDALDRRFRACGLSKGAALAPVLNAMGYSLMAMGNDIALTYGPQAMSALAKRLSFPVLAANFRDGDGPLIAGLQESATFPAGEGISLGVFGLTAPWEGMYEGFGIHMPDSLQTARRLVRSLQGAGATVIVVLSHQGLEDDKRLVEAVEGIDLVIGGHSHTRLETGVEHQGVLIAQAGDFAQALGVIELEIDAASGRLLRRTARLEKVPVDGPADPAFLAALAQAETEAEAIAAQVIGEALHELALDFRAECALGNLAADALRDRMRAEAALIIAGQFRQGLPAGKITLGDLDSCSSSTANPQRTRVRGAQIVEALERGLDPEVSQASPHSLRGTPIGRPQISGIAVEYDPRSAVRRRVRKVLIHGEPLVPDRMYWLAHTDAETFEGIGVLTLEPDQVTESERPTIVREVIEDYVRAHSPLAAPKLDRWRQAG